MVRRGADLSDSMTVRVVECVAAARDVSVLDLPPLDRTVDTDAIDSLFTPHDREGCSIGFTYAGTAVEISADGEVQASLLDEPGSD